jgi:hypothetical protein
MELGVSEGKVRRRLEEVAVGENSEGKYTKIGLENSESLLWEAQAEKAHVAAE